MEELRALIDSERLDKDSFINEYQHRSLVEEIMWQQKSRVRWLKKGVANFHIKVNFIASLEVGENTVEDVKSISHALYEYYYKAIMCSSSSQRFKGVGIICFLLRM